MTSPLDLRHYVREDGPTIRALLLDIHDEVYAGTDDPLAERDEFAQFADDWMSRDDFACVIGYDDEPVGYAYGAPLSPATTWWDKVTPTPPTAMRVETGTRTFALSELMVRHQWRGTGAARRIHDALLNTRSEERVTLFTHQAHPKVRQLYEQWGYEVIGEAVPFDGAPELWAMLRPLR